MYISNLRLRKWVKRIFIFLTIVFVFLAQNFYGLYQRTLLGTDFGIENLLAKLVISVLLAAVTAFFTYKTLQKN